MSEALAKKEHEIIALFRKAAWEVDQKEFGDLQLKDKISDLGLDSVAMLEVIGYLEEELSLHLPDEKLARVQTLQDLSDLVGHLLPSSN